MLFELLFWNFALWIVGVVYAVLMFRKDKEEMVSAILWVCFLVFALSILFWLSVIASILLERPLQ